MTTQPMMPVADAPAAVASTTPAAPARDVALLEQVLNGRLTLYATRTATDQLRATRGISISITSREMMPESGLYVVTARATDRNERTDEAVGAVSIAGLRGESRANALMTAKRKADLLAFLRAEVGETPLGATAQVREWFRRNPHADVIALVAEVYRYKLAHEEEQG